MRTFLFVSGETVTALINIASVAVFLGAAAAIYSQSIETALLVAAAAFISGAAGFGYSVWRLHGHRGRVLFRA